MAITKTILRKTYCDVAVKVAGPPGIVTIDIAADLLTHNESLVSGGTPTVNISGLVWTGGPTGVITISRGGVVITTLLPSAAGFLDFTGAQFPMPDPINNTSNIVVTIAGEQSEVWMTLRKVAGYKNTDQLTTMQSI